MSEVRKYKLPKNTIVEVIAKKGDKIIKKEMTYKKALNLKKSNGWTYEFYELGFSQYKINKQ